MEKDFVKENSWPQLVPQLKLVIQSSDAISPGQHPEWKTINALTVLQAILRPFQVYFNFQGRALHIYMCFALVQHVSEIQPLTLCVSLKKNAHLLWLQSILPPAF